ncbi:MAG: hypothetical protein OXU20_29390 [Myxococcales bacterium]|nr:hypothetical protein [Myxococcales bacterium]
MFFVENPVQFVVPANTRPDGLYFDTGTMTVTFGPVPDWEGFGTFDVSEVKLIPEHSDLDAGLWTVEDVGQSDRNGFRRIQVTFKGPDFSAAYREELDADAKQARLAEVVANLKERLDKADPTSAQGRKEIFAALRFGRDALDNGEQQRLYRAFLQARQVTLELSITRPGADECDPADARPLTLELDYATSKHSRKRSSGFWSRFGRPFRGDPGGGGEPSRRRRVSGSDPEQD